MNAEPPYLCDYEHEDGLHRADWVYVGEAGDFFACEEHFQMRTEEGRRGWRRIT